MCAKLLPAFVILLVLGTMRIVVIVVLVRALDAIIIFHLCHRPKRAPPYGAVCARAVGRRGCQVAAVRICKRERGGGREKGRKGGRSVR
jgi:hypothetical protein